jgi:hypothetical protein
LISTISIVNSENITKKDNATILKTLNEDDIVSMLEQLDEEMMQGYIQDLVEIAESYDASRLTGKEGCEEARDYILNEFFNIGINTKIYDWAAQGLIMPYQHLLFVSENIEGTINGKLGSKQIILLMAHYDTVMLTPSADDNSAGVAAVLSAAKIMSQYSFNHEIRFLLISGEEQGLLGSTAYAQNSYETCDSIVTVINLDMIGYSSQDIEGDENKVRVYETCSDKITDDVKEICDNPDYLPYINFEVYASKDDNGHGSDQRSFCNYGFDAAFLHEYTWNDNKDTGTDTIENMDINYATRVARLAVALVAKCALSPILDNHAPKPPNYVDGPDESKINEEQTYTTVATDPDDDKIYYMFDWGDGTHSNWLGPYNSGEICQAKHTWTEQGDFKIKAKVKDEYGIQSTWENAPKGIDAKNLFSFRFYKFLEFLECLKISKNLIF